MRNLFLICLCAALAGLPRIALAGPEAGALAAAGAVPAAVDRSAGPRGIVPAPGQAAVTLRIVGTEIVTRITGRDSPNDTATRWDVHGTDLGHMFRHRGRLYMVFGDTFGAKGPFGRKNWRSNTMALIADPDPRNGLPIASMIAGPDGAAKELLPSRKVDGVEMTVIPTYGVSLDGRMYLHYMSVRHWGKPDTWAVNHSGLAWSDDDGQSWTVPAPAGWPQHSGFDQVAFVLHGDALYAFGIPEGRFGAVRLLRVAPEHILDSDAYEYWDGAGWAAAPAEAAIVVPAPAGELSVAWSRTHRRWLMMYLEPVRRAVVLRTAPRLTGPWGKAHVVAGAQDYPGLYAPFIVPGSDIDADLYYTMSQWDPYNVFLMRTALEWGGVATVSAESSAAVPAAAPAPAAARAIPVADTH